MKVKKLIEMLQDLPEDANVELGKMFAITGEQLKDYPDDIEFPPNFSESGQYELILDFPIVGLSYHTGDNDARFIVEHAPELSTFGQVRSLL